ncbi:FecR family protein [Paraflavitalea pollutisoli]|uniref:FecR family protein n=1 Tax=Paraflavitalea pollutisoli TaxID=3034143 RepID=UPI0023EDA367|nr:FecR domain-containing protein [Paraflavitalea sp. H1-2-19X]
MYDNRFLLLMTRKLSGEGTPEELEELNGLLSAHPSLQEEADLYTRYWEQQQEPYADTEPALQKVLRQIDSDAVPGAVSPVGIVTRMPLWKKISRVAAILVVAAGVGAGAYQLVARQYEDPTSLVQKQNSKGVKSTIVLSDGSKVWLNADSKVQYPALFTGNSREIYLNGEAFFDIVRNPAKPFIIHLSNGTVRVLGTSFNIKAYDNQPVVETSVATGKVAFIPRLKNNRPGDTVFVVPNNKVVYRLNLEEVTTAATVSADDKAWTEGKLIFRSQSFEEIAIELERNFGKRIVFDNDTVKQYRLTGSFQNNTLVEILEYLSITKTFSYSVSDEAIVISR